MPRLEASPSSVGERVPTIHHWISGQSTASSGTQPREGTVYNPALGSASARLAYASEADVDRAVAAARDAFESWARAPLGRRAAILFKFRELVSRNAEDLARCIVREHGKVLADARGEVQRG